MIRTPFVTPPPAWRTNLTKLTALLLASTMTGTAAGCGGAGDSATGPSAAAVGTYSLQQIDKKAVPAQVYRGPYYSETDERYYMVMDVTVRDGTFRLDDSGRYHSSMNYVVIKDGREELGTLQAGGTYEVRGDEIILTLDTGEWGSGTIGKGTVTLWWDIVGKGVEKPFTFTK